MDTEHVAEGEDVVVGWQTMGYCIFNWLKWLQLGGGHLSSGLVDDKVHSKPSPK